MNSLSDVDVDKLLIKYCGNDTVYGVKYKPSYPAKKCHDNAFDYCAEHPGYLMIRGWEFVYVTLDGVDLVMLIFHSVVKDLTNKSLIDITKSAHEDNHKFIVDEKWLAISCKIPNNIDPHVDCYAIRRPNYLFNRNTGKVKQWFEGEPLPYELVGFVG